MRVFKFGGGILKDADSFKKMALLLRQYESERLIIVLSAINKTTNKFESLISEYYHDKSFFHASFGNIKFFHLNIAKELGFGDESDLIQRINRIFDEILRKFEDYHSYPYHVLYDQIVSYGEFLSCQIVHAYLNTVGLKNAFIDARMLVKTNSRHQNAEVDFDLSRIKINQALESGERIYITQGFVGSDTNGMTTTLGREGSDYSAAIFASIINAGQLVLWKDVPGIYNADPKYYKDAVLIRELNHADARKLTDLGAKVLHHKTIKPLEEKGIPLFLNLFEIPVQIGTSIYPNALPQSKLPVIVHRFNKILFTVKSLIKVSLNDDDEQVIRQMIGRQQLEINYIHIQDQSCYFSLNHFVEPVIALRDELRRKYKVDIQFGVCMVKVQNANESIIQTILKDVELLHRDRLADIIYLFY